MKKAEDSINRFSKASVAIDRLNDKLATVVQAEEEKGKPMLVIC